MHTRKMERTTMAIIEYSLNTTPPSIPSYVIHGGYFQNPDNYKLIGTGEEGSFPDSLTTFTLEELQARQRAIHAKYPMRNAIRENDDDFSVDEVNAAVKTWFDAI